LHSHLDQGLARENKAVFIQFAGLQNGRGCAGHDRTGPDDTHTIIQVWRDAAKENAPGQGFSVATEIGSRQLRWHSLACQGGDSCPCGAEVYGVYAGRCPV